MGNQRRLGQNIIYRWKIYVSKLTTGFLSSLSTLRQSSRNDDMMPDFGLVKRLLMKLSGALVSSSLYRNNRNPKYMLCPRALKWGQ